MTPIMAARRAAFFDLFRLLALTEKPFWATPVLIALGLLSSLAETAGITLVLLFVYSAMGQLDAALLTDGLVDSMLRQVTVFFGGSAGIALGIFLLIVVRGLLAFAYDLTSAYVSEKISEAARIQLHAQILNLPYSFIQSYEQAELMELLSTESWLVAGAYNSFTRLIVSICSIVVFAAVLLILSWQITFVAVAGSALLAVILRFLAEPARRLGRRVKQVHRELAEQVLISLEAMRTIRAYGLEHIYHQRFIRFSSEARDTSIQLARLAATLNPVTEVGYLGILCAIIAGATYWQMPFATTLAAIALLYRLQPYVRSLEGNLLHLAQIQPQLASVRSMLEQKPKTSVVAGDTPISSIAKSIRFDAVTFQYDGGAEPALTNVSFSIPAGVTTALVGSSGAGKTTIVNLLLRLYQPVDGAIAVDGVALDRLRRSDWLNLLAIAGQDVDLIEGTVMENIRMAKTDAAEAEVVEAARIAGVADFVESLPEGYETWVGQQGLRFSGGQRQRVGLARALLRRPQFLILDEATNALDTELESRIGHAIETYFPGQTVLLITHRIETARRAKHVVCIERGRVTAEGPAGEIFARPPASS